MLPAGFGGVGPRGSHGRGLRQRSLRLRGNIEAGGAHIGRRRRDAAQQDGKGTRDGSR